MALLAHGTDVERALQILHDGRILPDAKPRMLQRSARRVFFQALVRAALPRRRPAMFWGPAVVFLFPVTVLRGQRGTYGPVGSFDTPGVARFAFADEDDVGRFVASVFGGVKAHSVADFLHLNEITLERAVPVCQAVAVLAQTPAVASALRRSRVGVPVIVTEGRTYLQVFDRACMSV